MKHIVYISGTRADFGVMAGLLKKLDRAKGFKVAVIATGMHMMEKFGYSIKEVKKSGLHIISINSVFRKDDKPSVLVFLSDFIEELTKKINKLKPDFILIVGDRIESLAGAIVGAYLSIPVVHFHGGEISSTIDEIARHAITKLSHIHLCATEKSAERIIRLGEEPFRVRVVGSPSLYHISKIKKIPKKHLFETFGFDISKPLVLVVQHPVTLEESKSYSQMHNTLKALEELGCQSLIIYPNSDPGSSKIIDAINKFRDSSNFVIRKNISYNVFISLMSHAGIMVGNSSSGIIEAPYFKLPVVNIGTRQNGREKAKNVIDCNYDKGQIKKSIEHALSKEFKNKISKIKNPYDAGNTLKNVLNVLNSVQVNDKLLQKTLTY